jgi:hypothetical protein
MSTGETITLTLASLFVGGLVALTVVDKLASNILDDARAAQAVENSKCSLRGLVLLRGQLGEYVCVVPGSERGRRKP